MADLRGSVAVVAGASRGAGRGIALALGGAGATVYVTGRTMRGGAKPADGAVGTIEDTAAEVDARGGRGIAVRVDYTKPEEVAALFQRVQSEQGKLDVLANAVWGGSDGITSSKQMMDLWGKPFWEQPPEHWQHIMGAPYAYYLASLHAVRLMAPRRKGLIVGITDGIMDGVDDEVLSGAIKGDIMGQLVWSLAHECINRLMRGMSAETRKHKIAVVTLMPGFMKTERVVQYLDGDEKMKKMFRFDLAESTEYVGRAVAGLAADKKVLDKTGRIHFVADLAKEYGFTDIDGRVIPRFAPHGG